MARIDTGTIAAESPVASDGDHRGGARPGGTYAAPASVEVSAHGDALVRLDPWLTATAIAHVLENASNIRRLRSTEVSTGVA